MQKNEFRYTCTRTVLPGWQDLSRDGRRVEREKRREWNERDPTELNEELSHRARSDQSSVRR